MKSQQRNSSDSPRFAQPATFMRLPHQTDLKGVDVALLGVPFDSGTSVSIGRAAGSARDPRPIVAHQAVPIFPRRSPFAELTVVDAGDVDAPPVGIEQAFTAIEAGVRNASWTRALYRSLPGATIPFRFQFCARSPPRTGRSAWSSSTRTSIRGGTTSAASISTARRSGGRSKRAWSRAAVRPDRHPRPDVRRDRRFRVSE